MAPPRNQQARMTDRQIANSVAVIGMAARLPGAADIETFWANLCAGRHAIARLGDDELRAAGVSEAAIRDPAFVRAFGLLDGVDRFDAGFFGYPRSRAEALDPQQRILLECAWTALDHAGYAPGTSVDSTGVYLSIAQSSYRPAAAEDAADGFFALTSTDKDYAATRISYKLGLTGPSMMVQTACSGSLAALHIAVEALLAGQCDMAIAGGCTIALPQGGYRHRDGLMLSRSGLCRAFDAAADGAVPGNGAGVVVLKPLAQALADRDTVYCVVRGTALNNDGNLKTDYLAPSVQGQARAIGEALTVAEVAADSIGYIEAHGTGTLLGDPIEIRALAQAYRHFTERRQFCRIGSVKASIGHLNVASGIAGFIKAALAVYRGLIPPSLHYAASNPEIDFAATPFAVATEPTEWAPADHPRRAGVSSFGFGGTNVHVIVEEAPPLSAIDAASGPVVLPVSAKTEAALVTATAELADFIERRPGLGLADLAYTLQCGRRGFGHRRAIVCDDAADAVALLRGQPTAAHDRTERLAEVARRWQTGENVDWGSLHRPGERRRIAAPTYPFQRERYWVPQHAAEPREKTPVPPLATPTGSSSETGILAWVTGVFAAEIGQQPASLDPDATYDRFGIDSLLVVSITGKLHERFPGIRSTLLFEHNTLRRLARHLATVPMATPAAIPAPTVATGPAAQAPGAEPIAVIGLAGRYPGAPDLDAFWENLRDGRSGIREVPAERWDWRDHFDPADPGKSYTRWAGFIDDIDKFDPLFFGIAPREAKLLDPQQRIFLEAVWAAIEDAGYTRAGLREAAERAKAADVGVFVGVMNLGWRLTGLGAAEAGQVVQANHWSVANRVSYLFDFRGPSLAVDTACSASLTALHLACESLRRGECGVAIAGGVNLILHPVQQLELCRMGMLSHGDRCHAFGAEGDGFIQGEGVGAAVLKPLAAAQADGDRIYGVILGSAINADGRTAGYTVPSPAAQTAVIRAAMTRARVEPETIGYVECHGTGTALGDPIEVSGLTDAFGPAAAGIAPCAIGSVKSNIGHLESAAGIASLTKVLLQLRHMTMAPSLNAETLNPRIDFAATPFRVQQGAAPWPPRRDAAGREMPRRAGISGFGAGGANAHVIVEEGPVPPARPAEAAQPCLVPLSARNPERLSALAAGLRDHVARKQASLGPAELRDLAYTLAVGREAMECRAAFIVRDAAELTRALTDFVATGSEPPDDIEVSALANLARRWRAGEAVDLAGLYAGEPRRRVSFPSYPFAREPCWLPEMPPKPAIAAPSPGSTALAGRPRPTLAAEACWDYRLDPDDPVLRGHTVAGLPTLPGVCALEMALSAGRQVAALPIAVFEDVYWLTPVTVTSPLAVGLTLSATGEAFAFELRDAAAQQVHSRGLLLPGAAAAPEPVLPIAEIEARCAAALPASDFYRRFTELGLAYEAGLRTVETIRVGDGEAIARAAMPAAGDPFSGCALHPGLLDAALQTAAFIVFRDNAAVRLLPFGLARLELLGPLPARVVIHARRVSDPERRDIVRFDVTVTDEHGVPALRLHDLAGREDARPAPTDTAEGWFYIPAWEPAPVSQSAVGAAGEAASVIAESGDLVAAALLERLGDGARRVDLAPLREDLAAVPDALRGAADIHFVIPSAEDPTRPRAVLALLALLRALKAGDAAARPLRLTVIGRCVFDVLPDEQGAPHAAACFGLARVAAKECPGWQVRCLDLGDAADLGPALRDPGDPLGREIAYRNGRRYLRMLRPHPAGPGGPAAFREGGCYVILGGAGGIGLALAEHLLRHYRARLTLIGRSALTAERAASLDRLRRIGGDVVYLHADATDRAALRGAVAAARERFGRIDGALHAAIVMEDRSLDRMDAATFRAAYDAKALGCVNFAEALAEQPPDWVAFFSSANSFAANAGQANYVAGCAFEDSFARALAKDAPFRVRLIDWGFWGEVGRVATPAYRARLARLGVTPIGTAEGIAAIERLIGGSEVQVLALKAEPRVLHELGLAAETEAAVPDRALPKLAARLAAYAGRQAPAMQGAAAEYRALDRLAQRRLARWWADAGLIPDQDAILSAEDMRRRIGVAPRHYRQFDALLDIVARAGWLEAAGAGWRCAAAPRELPSAEAVAVEAAAFRAAHPAFRPHLDLLELCFESYGEILADRLNATAVLFPDLSMSRVDAMYKGNRVVDYNNGAVAEAVRALVEAHAGSGRPVRLLEFGAGTGGTSQAVLPALAAAGLPVEYVYTDISLGFTQHGQRQFAERFPFVRFRALDLEKHPSEQGFAEGEFAVALGANVIHATAKLSRSLGHLRHMLMPDGALVLYEMTAAHDFVTLTFGLLDGWWKAEDERLAYTPLLDAPGWLALLKANGFPEVRVFGEPGVADPRDFRHSVIVAARSTGLARGEAAPADTKPEAPARVPLLRARRSGSKESAPPANPLCPARAALRDLVRETVAKTLEMRVVDLDPQRKFADYGADSILSVELVTALNARLGIELKPTALFSYPSVELLAEYIAATYPAAITTQPTDPEPAAGPAPAPLPAVSDQPRPIAVIGIAGRFPGADNLGAFWRNLAGGRDSVGEVPAERWDHAAIYDPDPLRPGKTNCRHGGFLDDIASFDPLFFNLSPAEATAMDPQQRLFLEEAWHAVEDAGYSAAALDNLACGVFVGSVAGDYDDRLRAAGRADDAQSFTGNAPSMLAARIAYHLNLRGPSITIDTACSSSLVAIHLACESLRRGESELALAGGVAVMTTPRFYTVAAKAGMLSPSGRCRTLDAAADGFVPGEGVGIVVLKELATAQADGDHVYGVVLGSGINQDGASNGITAPNSRAQAELERAVHGRAGVAPDTIGYVELHGTGTKLGDPIEIDGLREAFAEAAGPPGFCAVGSVKSNIGHALAAAGVAGLIKVLLALQHRTIPPTLHLRQANPHLDLAAGPFSAPTSPTPWQPVGRAERLRAAISSFGFSGTNAHLVVEEAPEPPRAAAAPRPCDLVAVSARTEGALLRRMQDLLNWLREGSAEARFDDICATLNAGRSHFAWRASFVAGDAAEFAAALMQAIADPGARRELAVRPLNGAGSHTAGDFGRAEYERLHSAYLAGEPIDWAAMYPAGSWRRVSLPTYPFERRHCWPTEPAMTRPRIATATLPPSAANRARPSLLQAVVGELDRTINGQGTNRQGINGQEIAAWPSP